MQIEGRFPYPDAHCCKILEYAILESVAWFLIQQRDLSGILSS